MIYSILRLFIPTTYLKYENINNIQIFIKITQHKRNLTPCIVRSHESGDESSMIRILIQHPRKIKNNQNENLFLRQKIIPVGYEIFDNICRIEKAILNRIVIPIS
jgi:hypothetical protein